MSFQTHFETMPLHLRENICGTDMEETMNTDRIFGNRVVRRLLGDRSVAVSTLLR